MNRPRNAVLWLTVCILAALAIPASARGSGEAGGRISISEASRLVEAGDAVFVDVRDEASYVTSHITGAIHIPYGEIRSRVSELTADGRTVIAYCSCPAEETSLAAASDLVAAGFTNVRVLDGGIAAWAEAGLPLKQGPRP